MVLCVSFNLEDGLNCFKAGYFPVSARSRHPLARARPARAGGTGRGAAAHAAGVGQAPDDHADRHVGDKTPPGFIVETLLRTRQDESTRSLSLGFFKNPIIRLMQDDTMSSGIMCGAWVMMCRRARYLRASRNMSLKRCEAETPPDSSSSPPPVAPVKILLASSKKICSSGSPS